MTRSTRTILTSLLTPIAALALATTACTRAPTDAAPGNRPLTIDAIPDQRTTRAHPIDVPIVVGDENPNTVRLSATSDDATLIADTGLSFLGTGTTRSLRIASTPNGLGTTRITVTAQNDENDEASTTFTIQVEQPFQAAPQKITVRAGGPQDRFGESVALFDGNALVGAPGYDTLYLDVGSGYFFERSDAVWTQNRQVITDQAVDNSYFGEGVALNDDHALVGTRYDDDKGINAGAAYLYERTDTSWTLSTKLTASDGGPDDWFGRFVAIAGDHALISAHGDDENALNAGAAYIFERAGSAWAQTAKLTTNDGDPYDYLGTSVAIDGDVAVIGAHGDDGKGLDAGAAYIFERAGSAWAQTAKLTADDGAFDAWLGSSVAIHGDFALIGAWGDDERGQYAGAAYVFERADGNWTQAAKLAANDGGEYDYFGFAVAIDGEYAAIGAYGDDDNGESAGAAYIYRRTPIGWIQIAKIVADDGEADDRFGTSVAIDGDDVLVGAWGDDDDGREAGAAYLFQR